MHPAHFKWDLVVSLCHGLTRTVRLCMATRGSALDSGLPKNTLFSRRSQPEPVLHYAPKVLSRH